ncbi:YggT family protein [Lactococcus allomyrinae]|uniref:YggT family protein n=1 Tax=Lactococcus allomyrinae TaxID=2419773 RepID=A0A387BHR5_9LACT|nr:YggT family protein [Lactococcus allomyrinae]AYG00929.1 YggT family protein [Lactococcus allomyrinae]
MLTILTLVSWLFRLMDVYSFILVIYALMSWIPSLYGTWIGQLIIKISRPYLSLFENLPLRIAGLDFTIWVAIIALQLIQRFIAIVLNGILF